MRRWQVRLVWLGSVALLAGALFPAATPLPGAVEVAARSRPVPAADAGSRCADGQPITASLAPGRISVDPDTVTDSPTLQRIRERGRLVVGTSGDVLLWGSSVGDSNKLDGFDIALARRVAAALGLADRVEFKVISSAQRLPALAAGDVDLVARTLSITCDRWQGTGNASAAINFSTEYYRAGQKVLVRADQDVDSIADLRGQRVCVQDGSTSEAAIAEGNANGIDVVAVPVDFVGECLVRFQEGDVVAITGDDTILAGFAEQDPYARIVGERFSQEPYGLGIAAGDAQFTRWVNAVLAQLRADGTLRELYRTYMGEFAPGSVSQPVYGRLPERLGRTDG